MFMYPQSNSARSVRDLSGVWDFRFNADEPWQPIAVPASYNDQSPDPEFRRHYGHELRHHRPGDRAGK